MKVKHLLGMAAVALMAAACSNDLNDVLAPEAPQKGIPFVATIAPKTFDATTRALTLETDDDGKNYLKAEWKVDEEIMLTYIANDETIQTIASVVAVSSEDGSATIKANLVAGVADGATVQLVYPASSATPSGNYGDPPTVNYGYVINDLDIRYATSTINVKDEVATLVGGISLNPQYAIVRFIIKNLAGDEVAMKKLVVKRGDSSSYSYEVSESAAGQVNFFVALPSITDEELWFEALDSDGNPYIAKGIANLMAGMFYETDLKMATVGDVILADGKFAAPKTEGAEAMIAYLGTEAEDAPHGLAIALKDASSSNVTWDNSGDNNDDKTAAELVAAWASSNEVTGGTWRLPSADDWKYMFQGCGGDAYTEELTDDMEFSHGDFRTKLKAAGGDSADVRSSCYWSATEYDFNSNCAWYYYFLDGRFWWSYKESNGYIRAALAF